MQWECIHWPKTIENGYGSKISVKQQLGLWDFCSWTLVEIWAGKCEQNTPPLRPPFIPSTKGEGGLGSNFIISK